MAIYTYKPTPQKVEARRSRAGVILKQHGQEPAKVQLETALRVGKSLQRYGWRQLCGQENFLCKQEDLRLSCQHPHKKMALVSDVT